MNIQHLCLAGTLALVFAVGTPDLAAQQTKVIPATYTSTEGPTYTYFPFGYTNPRVQQIFRGDAVTRSTALIDGVSFRMDTPTRLALVSRSYTNVQVRLGSTSVAPDGMSTTFANNITSALTTVFNKAFNLPAQPARATGPAPFDIRFAWQQPHLFAPVNGGHLMLDMTLPGTVSKSNYFVDAAPVQGGGSNGSITPFGKSGTFSQAESFALTADTGSLTPGGTLDMKCGVFRNAYAGNLVFSLSDKTWGTVPLPLDLAILGAPGNNLYVGYDVVHGFNTARTTSGNISTFRAPIPNQQVFNGLTFYTQAYYADRQANGLGLVTTHGLALTVAAKTGPVTNQLGHYDSTQRVGAFRFTNGTYGGAIVQFKGILP